VQFVNSNVSVIPRFHTSVLKTSECPAVYRNTTSWERLISFVYGTVTSWFVLLTKCYLGNRIEEDGVGGTILKRILMKLDGKASTGYFWLSYKVVEFCATVGVRTAQKTLSGPLRNIRHVCRSPCTESRLTSIWIWQCMSVNSPNMSPCACGRTDGRMWRSK
jgi:hypothetical protein